ncbi:hypothetical protein RUND412_003603 [Rhizina undulata]
MATDTLENVLEADSDFSGSDYESSTYASGFESDTTSLLTIAKNHTFENGRRYHGYKEGKYPLPNDEAEQDRMDLHHHCCLLALQGELFIAPVGKGWKPQRILEIGTGSGIWAVDIADQYPSAEIIGVDLSPIQPSWVPPNLSFQVDDVEETWSFRDNSFDLIYFRCMAGSITDWPKLYRQAFKALRPGGWIEVHDVCDTFSSDDNSLPADSILQKWEDNWEKATIAYGRQWRTVAPGIANALKYAGCVEVGGKVVKLPIGPWPKVKELKELGVYWRQDLIDGTEAACLAPFTRILGWDKKDVDKFVVDVRAALKNTRQHVYSKFHCIYGRKPEVR